MLVRLRNFLATPRLSRLRADVDWVYDLFLRYKSIDYARRQARQIGRGGMVRGAGSVSNTEEKRFILEMILHVVNRDR